MPRNRTPNPDHPDTSTIIQVAFPGILAEEAVRLASTGRVCTYPADTILCHEDAIETTFYIILEGEVLVTKHINDAEARELKRLHPGDFFGEMALIHNAPRAATVKSVAPITVLEIDKDAFDALLERNSPVSLAMVREVSRRLRENDQMAIEDLRVKANELAAAYQQLTMLEYARSQFLTTIAHELRTPLMAANGFLQVIRQGSLQGEAMSSALDTVSRNLQDIVSLANDILFLQEMDLIMPEATLTDIGRLVAAAVEGQRLHAERGGISFSMNIDSGLPRILADPKTLEKAVTAILDNAIKFSPDGGDVRVQVTKEAEYILISIQDHGVGIPSEAMPHIFDRFYHLDEVDGHLFRGVGLGLSIARHVVEGLGGSIEVDSQLGRGSTFSIKLIK
jgi:signal transduction histidine kinase